MANDIIKLAGENAEHSEQVEVLPQSTLPEDCTSLADKAIALGALPEIADQFTSEGMHALRAKVPAEIAVGFKVNYQTEALELLGIENAETALLFTDNLKALSLSKALKLGLSPQIALHIKTDELFSKFSTLTQNNPVVGALKLGVPIERAFEFDTDHKVQAWNKIKRERKNRETGIADALNIDSQTKLDALLSGVYHKISKFFIYTSQVQAWNMIKGIVSDKVKAAEYALAIDTQTKLDALIAGVDPIHANQFINSYQIQAWYVIKTFIPTTAEQATGAQYLDKSKGITYALAIDTKIKLDALHAGIDPELASKFTDPLQVQAWEMIHKQIADKKQSAEYALEITDTIKLEALKIGIYPGDAVNFKSKIQLDAWKQIKDRPNINKYKAMQDVEKLQNLHQLDVLLGGADLKDALQITERSQAEAYIAHKLPLELAMKFTKPHQIQLLHIKIAPQEASETNWYKAQYIQVTTAPKKYFADIFKNVKTSWQNEIKHLNENRDEIPGFIALPIAIGSVGAFALWSMKKIATYCCCKPKIVLEEGQVRVTSTTADGKTTHDVVHTGPTSV